MAFSRVKDWFGREIDIFTSKKIELEGKWHGIDRSIGGVGVGVGKGHLLQSKRLID